MTRRIRRGLMAGLGLACGLALLLEAADAPRTVVSEPPPLLRLENIVLTSTANAPAASGPAEYSCDVTLEARPLVAAMVALALDAPCLPEARFVLHHNGMMFSARTDAEGRARLTVPALSRNAVFIAAFDTGHGAVAQQDVTDLSDLTRIVLQWHGDPGLGLHAREFGAAYFTPGHVHGGAAGTLAGLAEGRTGFLQRLGTGTTPLRADVYTFPSGAARSGGTIQLTIEAEITRQNCGTEIEAQTIEARPGRGLRAQDVMLYMPGCDAVGDFLVLKNTLEDLTLSSR